MKYGAYNSVFAGVTEHGYIRARERLGWNKKATDRMAKKIYNSDRTLTTKEQDYINILSRSDKGIYKVHGENVFVFDNMKLITVLKLSGTESTKLTKGN